MQWLLLLSELRLHQDGRCVIAIDTAKWLFDKVSNKFCQKLAVNSLETFTEIIDGLEDANQGKAIHQNSTMLVN